MKRLLTLCAAAISADLLAADRTLLVLHKGDSSLGFYSPAGKMSRKVKLNLHPHEMVLSPDRRWLYITENGTMRIENIAAGGNSVAIVDLNSRKVTSVSTGTFRRPHGIALAGDLFVTTEAPDQVLRLRDRQVMDTYGAVGRIAHMASVDPQAKFAYVSNSGSGTVSIVDLSTKAVTNVATGKRPEGSVLSPDGRFLYVCNRESAIISVIDTRSKKLAAQIETGKGPVRIGVTSDGATLVYALMHDKAIGFADTKTRRETGRVSVEGSPVSLHLSSDSTMAYAASEEADMVHLVVIGSRTILRSFKTPKGYAPDPVLGLP